MRPMKNVEELLSISYALRPNERWHINLFKSSVKSVSENALMQSYAFLCPDIGISSLRRSNCRN